MAKSQDAKKTAKKEPLLTAREKEQEKQTKETKKQTRLIDFQIHKSDSSFSNH